MKTCHSKQTEKIKHNINTASTQTKCHLLPPIKPEVTFMSCPHLYINEVDGYGVVTQSVVLLSGNTHMQMDLCDLIMPRLCLMMGVECCVNVGSVSMCKDEYEIH